MADIFISYARDDRTRIEPLGKTLEEVGWSVWWDWTVPVGKIWRQIISEALDAAACVVVAWSNDSIINRLIFIWTIMQHTLSSRFGNMNVHDQGISGPIASDLSLPC